MRILKHAWVVDWDRVDCVEHLKDILMDTAMAWSECPVHSGYLCEETPLESAYFDDGVGELH